MYHYQYPECRKEPQMFTRYSGINDLHMKFVHEMYWNRALTAYGIGNISPTWAPTDSSNFNGMLSPLQQSPTSTSSFSSGSSSPGSGNIIYAIHQRHPLAEHHQQLAAAAMANHQMALAAQSMRQQDEISKSLKMFAMSTAYSYGGESTVAVPSQMPQFSSVDDVMRDFADNGYICDEGNRSEVEMHLQNTPNLSQNSTVTGVSPASTLTVDAVHQRQQLEEHNDNLNYNNNCMKMFPAQLQQPTYAFTAANAVNVSTATATAAAAVNIDYNCNKKKFARRCNAPKNVRFTSSKHCVFCENNNEPEEVVKSHSVRDRMGRVLCPRLRTYTCPICKASGDMAHTVKYCPRKPIITMDDAVKAQSYRLAKKTYYVSQTKV